MDIQGCLVVPLNPKPQTPNPKPQNSKPLNPEPNPQSHAHVYFFRHPVVKVEGFSWQRFSFLKPDFKV